MNQIFGQQNIEQHRNRNDQPHSINVNAVVDVQQSNLNFKFQIDPQIPFNIFANGIKEQIFAQRMQAQYQDTIEYQLNNGLKLQQNDSRTLSTLGFTNNCTLYVRLKLTGDYKIYNKKRIYKVQVDLQIQKIELVIEQYTTTPISCVFHDILVELVQNQQLCITSPFIFFINETEIEPFDFRQISYFQTNKGILVKTILENTEANQDSVEKYKFAQNKSKEIKLCLKNMIKIQYNNDIEMLAYTDTSLQEIFKDICEDLKIFKSYPNCVKRYYINNEQFIEFNNIYAMNNIKLDIQYPNETQEIVFKVNGEFYKKIQIQGFILPRYNSYFIEEFMPINSSMTEFLQYLKFKIFGPYQNKYREEIEGQRDGFAFINYLNIN